MWFFGAFIPQILVKKMIQAWDHLIRECSEPIFSPSFCLLACGASTLFVRKSFGVLQSGATKKMRQFFKIMSLEWMGLLSKNGVFFW